MISPIVFLKQAQSRFPQLKFAWGLVGILAAAAIISVWFKSAIVAAVVFLLMLCGMFLLAIFASAAADARSKSARKVGAFLMWVCAIAFAFALFSVISAAAIGKPHNLAVLLHLTNLERIDNSMKIRPSDFLGFPLSATNSYKSKAGESTCYIYLQSNGLIYGSNHLYNDNLIFPFTMHPVVILLDKDSNQIDRIPLPSQTIAGKVPGPARQEQKEISYQIPNTSSLPITKFIKVEIYAE
jgi:hypothetical protein